MNASEQQNAAVESKLFFVFTDSASALSPVYSAATQLNSTRRRVELS